MTSTIPSQALPSASTVVSLLAGRLIYRLGLYGSGLLLLALWGPREFAYYATATGAAGWLFALTSSGPEKAALVLLPRKGGAGLERRFILLALAPTTVLTTAALVVWLTAPLSVSRFALAAALSTAVGGCAVLVALLRLRLQPRADLLAYLAIAAGHLVAVATVAFADAGVGTVLWLLVLLSLAVDLVLVFHLWPRTRALPVPAVLRRESWRAVGVLGVGELLGMGAFSLLFAYFAVTDDAHETSLFYVLVVVSSCASVGLLYLLRLFQPHVVLRSEAVGESRTWARARRILWLTLTAGAPATAAAAWFAVRSGHGLVAWGVLALEVALFAAVAVAVLLLESSGGRGRGWSAASAAVEFLVIAGSGWWLVAAAGAAGAFVALCLGALAKITLLLAARPFPVSPTAEDP